jgi:hypothetical protein
MENDEIHVIHEIQTPRLFKQIRGSSHGVHIGGHIWFLCHVVNPETSRRYYHIFVVIHAETYELIKYSQLFTFEREMVEYSLGFAYQKKDDQFLIGYSTNDNTTKYLLIGKDIIDDGISFSIESGFSLHETSSGFNGADLQRPNVRR